jgi:uncharacterized membrane protein
MEGFLLLVLALLVLVFIYKVNELSKKVDSLQAELYRRQQASSPTPTSNRPAAFEVPPAQPPAAKPFATPAIPFPTAQSLPPPPKPSRTRAEWEALVGGKLLNRIGAFALILGVGFF